MSKQLTINQTLYVHKTTIEEIAMDSVVPACCSEECMVEPDGFCEHGFESIIIKHFGGQKDFMDRGYNSSYCPIYIFNFKTRKKGSKIFQ